MRALYMLHEKPDIDRLLSFVSSFRQSDGSYATSTGGHRRPGRNVHGHDHHSLGPAAFGPAGRLPKLPVSRRSSRPRA